MPNRAAAILTSLALLAACTAPQPAPKLATTPPPPPAPPPQPASPAGLDRVVGQDATRLEALLGPADLDVRDGPARKLQFRGEVCVLDVYLYPPAAGGEPRATYTDARLPDGRDFDRASCIAALVRRVHPARR